jgi:type I restriction enzyme S subunit
MSSSTELESGGTLESPEWQELVNQSPYLGSFFGNLESFMESAKGIEKLRELILQLAVHGKLVEQDPEDEPASELLKRIAAEKEQLIKSGSLRKSNRLLEINEEPYGIPCSWTWTRLGNVQTYTNGYAFKSTEYQDGGIGIVRIGDIENGEISTDGMKFVPANLADKLDERFQVKPGDLLIAMSGATTGKLGFNRTKNTFLLNQRVGKIEMIHVNPQFACFFLTTKVQDNLRKSVGMAIPNLSIKQQQTQN